MSVFPCQLPSDAYFDDPAANIDRANEEHVLNLALAKETILRVLDWITRGGINQCGLRSYIVMLFICPERLPCK